MHIYNENIFRKVLKIAGVQDIEMGNDTFDKAFMVRGSDETIIKAMVTPTLQERLLKLTHKGLSLSLTQTELKLVVNYIPSTEMDYDPILDAFTAMLDVVRGGNS